MAQSRPKIGMIGLAVMGSNLARNIESRGVSVAVYNRSGEVTEQFMKAYGSGQFVASKSLEEFVASMDSPRQVFIMVKAGPPVDAVIDALIPLLSQGDIIIDGGNSYFKDTVAREKRCHQAGLNFMGLGVSGGEEGALKGPSLMPGGPEKAWDIMAPVLEKIAAQADGPCTTYIGPDGAGHFVKMVHNGIEYGDMQLIAEAYHLLHAVVGLKAPELAQVFTEWNAGPLSSFLIEITASIFNRRDDRQAGGDQYLVDKILDKAGQKGTGAWTAQVALDLGVAIPTLAAAVDARILSAMKDERVRASKILAAPSTASFAGDSSMYIAAVHDALFCSKVMAYAQGMALLSAASKEWNWHLKLDKIAAIWKGGCIIRARFLDEIRKAFAAEPGLDNLLLAPAICEQVTTRIANLRSVVRDASERGIPVLAFASSLSYFDSYRSAQLPQNLTQAQRDFFGAHTYQRVDMPGAFHTEW